MKPRHLMVGSVVNSVFETSRTDHPARRRYTAEQLISRTHHRENLKPSGLITLYSICSPLKGLTQIMMLPQILNSSARNGHNSVFSLRERPVGCSSGEG